MATHKNEKSGVLAKVFSYVLPIVSAALVIFLMTVTVKNGKIAVTHSDCPGKDCVGCGWQSQSGRSLVCLPNRMEIRIVTAKSDVDFVVG